MKLLKIEPILNDQQIKSLEGTYFSKDLIKHHITEDTKVLNENGDILAVYRGQAAGPLPADLKIGDKFNGLTVGKIGKNRFYPLLASGKLSKSPKAKAVHSSIIGFSDRYPRIPYCRRTVFTQNNWKHYNRCLPYVKCVDNFFAKYAPKRYKVLQAEQFF